MTKRQKSLIIFMGIFFLHVNINHVDGCILDNAEIGARPFSMAGAVVARADDIVSAMYYNPAGLTQIEGQNLGMGMVYVYYPVRYKDYHGYNKMNTLRPTLPYAAYSTDVLRPFILGIGFYSSMGSGFDFHKGTDKIYGGLMTQVGVLYISPTIAYQISPELSLGLEFNIGYGKSELDMPTPLGYLETEADGFGFGATIGLLYQPTAKWGMGLTWRSSMKSDLDGDAHLDNVKDSLDVYMYWPQSVTAGICYKPIHDLALEVDVVWADWSHFKHSRFKYESFNYLDGPIVRRPKDTYTLKIGAEYHLNEKIDLRCGYTYYPQAIPSADISPLIPDQTYKSYWVGLGWKVASFTLDLGFGYGYAGRKRVHQSSTGFSGSYDARNYIISSQISYNF